MFLDVLQEKNKEMFLEACVSAVMPGRSLTEKGRKMVLAYCREMGMAEHIPQSHDGIKKITAMLAERADIPERQAMALGILAFARTDGCMDEKRGFLEELVEGLKIGKDTADRLNFLLELCDSAYREMRRTILG